MPIPVALWPKAPILLGHSKAGSVDLNLAREWISALVFLWIVKFAVLQMACLLPEMAYRQSKRDCEPTFRRSMLIPSSRSKNKPSKKPVWKQWFLARLILRPRRWRRHVALKRRLTLNGLHGVIPEDRTPYNHRCENLKSCVMLRKAVSLLMTISRTGL
jgi:hypothetical protein